MSRGTPAKFDESIKELTLQGLTAREIGERLGLSMRTVVRARRRTGTSLTDEGSGHYSPEFKALMAERVADGWPFSEIAATYGVNEEAVARNFRGQGWTKAQASAYARLRKFEIDLYRAIDAKQYRVTYQRPLADVSTRHGATKNTLPGQSPTEAPPNAYSAPQRNIGHLYRNLAMAS